MLTYATILIASLIVALVVLFFYKVVSDSSRSVYSSKQPIAIISSTTNRQKDKAAHNTVTSASAFSGGKDRATPRNLAQIYPAMPTETINWGWQGSENQLREQVPHHGTGAGNVGHCSLYDVSTAEPVANSNKQAGWPRREEKIETGGKAYKVTRKVVPKTANLETAGKPWGW